MLKRIHIILFLTILCNAMQTKPKQPTVNFKLPLTTLLAPPALYTAAYWLGKVAHDKSVPPLLQRWLAKMEEVGASLTTVESLGILTLWYLGKVEFE